MLADLIVNADVMKENPAHAKKSKLQPQNALAIRKNLNANVNADAQKAKLVIAKNVIADAVVPKENPAHAKKNLLVNAKKKTAIVNVKRRFLAFSSVNANANAVANQKKANKLL